MNSNTITIVILIIIYIATFFYFQEAKMFDQEKLTVQGIQLPQSFVTQLNNDFSVNTNEFAYCLYGKIENGKVKVIESKSPINLQSTNEEIQIMYCDTNPLNPLMETKFVGTVHSHPSTICHLSEQDIFIFGKSNDAVMGIICGANKFYFYSQNDLIKSLSMEMI